MSEIEENKLLNPESEQEQTSGVLVQNPSPGEMLKEIRLDLGYSEEKVAEALHMTARYVKALENNQYQILPGKTFVKGYFKAYAILLHADVDEVLKRYHQHSEALFETEKSEAKVIRARKNYDQNKRWLFVTALIIIIVVGVSWWYR